MEENNIISKQEQLLPKTQISNMRGDRFSRIFFNISLTCMILSLVAIFSTVVLPLAQMFFILMGFMLLLAMIVLTFGTIFLAESNPVGKVWNFISNATDTSLTMDIIKYCLKALPYVCIIGLAISAMSITIGVISKQKGWKGRTVAVSIFAVIMLIVLIVYFAFGGGF